MKISTQKPNPALRRVHRQRHRRAEVVWAIISFLILQIGFAASIKTGLIRLDGGTTFSSKAAQFQQRLELADRDTLVVAAFGSSRIMNGFDAAGLERQLNQLRQNRHVVYNFGVAGGGNIYSYLSLEKLIAAGVKPDLILLELYPALLRPCGEQEWFASNEMRSKSFENTERYGIKSVSRPWYQEWLFPWHTYRFFVLNQIAPKLLPMELRENWAQQADEHGWIAVDHLPVEETVNKQLNRFRGCLDSFELSPDSCRAVRDTLRLCEQHRIQCKLVWMPEFTRIRKQYPPIVAVKINQFLQELETEFGVGSIVARDWIDDQGFYDSCHLNREGATRFTKRLAQKEFAMVPIEPIARSVDQQSGLRR